MNVKIISADWLSSHIPPDEELLREHLANDMFCSKSIKFIRDQTGQIIFDLPPSTMHWSRIWEWPWAIRAVPLTDKTVLNAGGGHSVMTCSLAKRCRHVIVADMDEGSLEHVRKQRPFTDYQNISTVKADLTAMGNWPSEYFDVVQCISVLEHIPNYAAALAGMLRVLKPGGKLVLTCDCEIVPAIGYSGPLEKCPKWDLTGMGQDLLKLLDVWPQPSNAMIGKVGEQLFMILAVILEKQA